MPKIEFVQLTKRFDAATAVVDQLTLSIDDGELLTIVGPTGSGKTTLLRMLAGLESPTTGDIRFDGRSIVATPAWQRGIGYAFQHPALLPHQSVRKQLGLNRTSADRRSQATQIEQLAQKLKIAHLLDRLPEQLSGGERQRVALAAVLVEAPRVILFDEPLGHLDGPQRIELRRLIRTLHNDLRQTMIYVTHDQSEALGLGDRVAVLNAGRVEQIGTPRQIYEEPASRFVATFVGSPPLNVTLGMLAKDGGILNFSAFNTTWVVDNLPLPGVQRHVLRSVYVGQRPERLRLHPLGEPDGSTHQAALEVQVIVVEPQGFRTWIHVAPIGDAIGLDQPWIVEISGEVGWQPGDRGRLTWDWTNAHWFDAHTGERLTPTTLAPLQSDNSKYEHPATGKEITGNERQRSPADH
jgi:ABC-type sugar transport system ATPase subunit